MESFLERHGDRVLGVLAGFDRLLFRGTLRSIAYPAGFDKFLGMCHVLYKDYAAFAQGISDRIKEHARQFAAERARPLVYVASASASKEDAARRIMNKDQVQEGLVCVLSCVEPCVAFTVRRNAERKVLEVALEHRKCLFLYFYFVDREFGLMHVRLQTWLPMPIQVCLNGREYLARRLDRAGIGYEKRDNCFTRIDDLRRAQAMLVDLEQRNWVSFLNALARRLNPWMDRRNPLDLRPYYWTIRESEYATDVMFRDEESLKAIYPALVEHAIRQFTSQDVMRFLERRTNSRFNGEASGNIRHRSEGVRIKHWVEENSIKMYDKQGSILRIETTINNPRRFKVRRQSTRNGERCSAWIPLRKSVTDMGRRVEICRAANERYLEALGVGGAPWPTPPMLDPVSRRIVHEGRNYRALRPIDPEEARLFAVLLDGRFLLQGFRNKDVRRRLFRCPGDDPAARKQASGRTTRLLRLLRAHGLIRKVSRTFYYRVTRKGTHVMSTALRLREVDVAALAV
jgi:hypothetical protein